MDMRIRGKKSMFYTMATIIFVSIYIYLVISKTNPFPDTDQMVLVTSKVKSMNSFIDSFEKDADRAIYITSFTTLLAMQNYISTKGTFLKDSEKAFNEIFLNGTYEGANLQLLDNVSFSDWQERINTKASTVGINVDFLVKKLAIYHEDPWHLVCNMSLQIYLTDELNTAAWNKTYNFKTKMSIENLEDPIYPLRTYGLVANSIRRTPFYGNFTRMNGGNFDPSHLLNHTLSGYYTNNTNAPSFLMRFENNLTSSRYGIESLVDLAQIDAQGLPTQQKSVVDYIYWSTNNPASNTVQNMPSWFRLDLAHQRLYQVLGHTT